MVWIIEAGEFQLQCTFFFVLINSFLSQNKFCHHRQNVHLQPKLFCKTQHAYHLFTSVTFNINFMCQPFKRLSVSLAISPWQTETLLLFTVGFYLGSLPGSGAIGWGAQLGVQTSLFSGGTPQPLKYLSGTSTATHGSLAIPLSSLPHSLPVML